MTTTKKTIDRQARLIVALDVPSNAEAKKLVQALGSHVHFYKIGLELFTAGSAHELIEWLGEQQKQVFVDLKMYDIPNTVAAAVRNLTQYAHVRMTTVHPIDQVMQAACAASEHIDILAVSVLTSLREADLAGARVTDLVIERTGRAMDCGCAGVIASGLEAPTIRDHCGDLPIIVSPGVRQVLTHDDQARTVSVSQAFERGADYIVVGRPITGAQQLKPQQVAEAIQLEIEQIFSS